jgi:hypothetical protein
VWALLPTSRLKVAILVWLGALVAPSFAFDGDIARLWIGQKGETDCGRAALASLIARVNGVSPSYAYDAIGKSEVEKPVKPSEGYSLDELIRAAKTLPQESERINLKPFGPEHVNIYVRKCDTHQEYFETLATLSAGGHPVIVRTQSRGAAAHYLLLVDFSVDKFLAIDPAIGIRRISATNLNRLMCGSAYLSIVFLGRLRETPTPSVLN